MRVHTKYLLAVLLAAAPPALAAKPPKVQWTKTFSGLSVAGGYSVTQTFDGGYVAAGATHADTGGYDVCYVVKTDSIGNLQWQRIDDWSLESQVRSIEQTADSGYVMAGTAVPGSRPESAGACLVRLNSHGGVRWQKVIDRRGVGFSVVQTGDGGFVVSELIPTVDSAICLIKTDSIGNLLWRKSYDMTYGMFSEYIPMRQTADRGFIIGAKTMIKVDSTGVLQWKRTYSGVHAAYSVVQTQDHGYAATGYLEPDSNQAGDDMYLLRTDSMGNLLWQRTYGRTKMGGLGYWVETGAKRGTLDGGLVATGYFDTYDDVTNFVLRTNANGDIDWQIVLGAETSAQYIRRTTDGGYITTGCKAGRLVLIKLAPERKR
jgi:hypothetical protein